MVWRYDLQTYLRERYGRHASASFSTFNRIPLRRRHTQQAHWALPELDGLLGDPALPDYPRSMRWRHYSSHHQYRQANDAARRTIGLRAHCSERAPFDGLLLTRPPRIALSLTAVIKQQLS